MKQSRHVDIICTARQARAPSSSRPYRPQDRAAAGRGRLPVCARELGCARPLHRSGPTNRGLGALRAAWLGLGSAALLLGAFGCSDASLRPAKDARLDAGSDWDSGASARADAAKLDRPAAAGPSDARGPALDAPASVPSLARDARAAHDEDAGVPARRIGEPCTSADACDDGLFCNGRELCVPLPAQADGGAVCVAGMPPCHRDACAEPGTCDCELGQGDVDQDGHRAASCGGDDCNDNLRSVHPGAVDLCDAVDDDCDPASIGVESEDLDGDGYLSVACMNLRRDGSGWNTGLDFDDARKDVNPDAAEVCDGVDNNCDGKIDEIGGVEDHSMAFTFFRDADKDGFGVMDASDGSQIKAFCGQAVLGWSLNNYDCDDTKQSVSPSRGELCNGLDDNCDGRRDEEPLEEKPDFPGTELECRGADGWTITKCPQNAANCNAQVGDGCETPLDTLCDCGACGVGCGFGCVQHACEEIESLAVGFNHSCAVTGGAVQLAACWGYNRHGELGDDSINDSPRPRRVERISGVRKISAGYYHSCAIAGAERGLYCWGDDSHGQLGANATDTIAMIPLPVIGVPSGAMIGVVDVAAGAHHTCAVQHDGKVACWGKGDSGQLGDGLTTQHDSVAPTLTRAAPGDTYLTGAKWVAAGLAHSCAVVGQEREVYCWGSNTYGQLGDMPGAASSAARQVVGLRQVDELALGAYHSCALSAGQMYCWGSNSYGQLGAAQASAEPARVEGLSDVVAIAAGAQHSCAVQADGTAYCWGLDSSGELGSAQLQPSAEAHPQPARVSLEGVARIFAGQGQHVCAVAMGSPVCWGSNVDGELGTGQVSNDSAVIGLMVTNLDGSKTCTK